MGLRCLSLVCLAVVLLGCTANANMGYGGTGTRVLSGASAASNTNVNSLARSNVGSYNSGNNVNAARLVSGTGSQVVTPVYGGSDNSDNSDDNTEDTSLTRNTGTGVLAGASSNSFSGSQNGFSTGSRMGGSGSNVASFSIGGAGDNGGSGFVSTSGNRAGGSDGVQVVQIDSSSMQDINSQIQGTIQNILSKFGFQMQQNVAGNSGFYQPGRTYLVQSNGQAGQGAGDMSQSQYQGAGQQSQRMSMGPGGQTQFTFSAAQPVMVSYRLVGSPGQPNSGMAFSVQSGQDQGSQESSAGSAASASNVGSGYAASVQPSRNSYGATQQAAAANVNTDDQDSDSAVASGGYAAPVTVAKKVSAPRYGGSNVAVVVPSRQTVRYAAQTNRKTEASSNVAYEQTSS